VRPKTAQFGTLKLHLTDTTIKEDEHQGKVGLVIALGPLAYVDDEQTQFHGQEVKVGDWVVAKASEGWGLTLTRNQVPCRMLTEANIRMKIPSPDAVW
jgi:co-chaperonin GroES (HSP10)